MLVCNLGSNHSSNPTYRCDQKWVLSKAKAWVWNLKSQNWVLSEAVEMGFVFGKKRERELDLWVLKKKKKIPRLYLGP